MCRCVVGGDVCWREGVCVVRIIAIFFLALLFVRNAVFGLFPNREKSEKGKKEGESDTCHLPLTIYPVHSIMPLLFFLCFAAQCLTYN